MEELFKVVPKKLLPEGEHCSLMIFNSLLNLLRVSIEYGGEAGPIKDIIEDMEKKLIGYRDFFLEDDQYGVDEKKRVGRPQNGESLFGIEGTFRQLTID
jgi:hypothetical protein